MRNCLEQLEIVDDRRIWMIAEAMRRGMAYEKIHNITKIDLWFIDKIAILVEMEQKLQRSAADSGAFKGSEADGIPGSCDCPALPEITEERSRQCGMQMALRAAYKMVDTCAAEFAAETPYYYSCLRTARMKQDDKHRKKEGSGAWFRSDPDRPGNRI